MDPDSSIIEQLKSISFFSNMSEHDLAQIAEITEQKSYEEGDVIIEERTAAERFFIIYRGKIEISKRFENGEHFVLAVHSDGDFFGEMALLDEGLRSATAQALEPTRVLEITRPNFETLLYKAPVVAYHIIKELSSRLRETGALLISFLQSRNRQLYRSYLDTISTVIQAMEAESGAGGQRQRVRRLATAIGQEMGLSEEEMLTLEINALIHDFGTASFPGPPLRLQTGAPAKSIIAAAQTFITLTAEPPAGKSFSSEQAVKDIAKSTGSEGSDPQVIRALKKLQRSGQLP